MGAHSSQVEWQQLQLLKGQQPLLRSLAHLLCQKSPLAGAEGVRQTPVRESLAPVGTGVMLHIHPGLPGNHREMDQGGHWHMMWPYDCAQRRDRNTHICSSRDGVYQSSSFRTQGIISAMTYTILMTVAPFCLHWISLKLQRKIILKKKNSAFAHWALLSCRATEAASVSEKEKHSLAHCSW